MILHQDVKVPFPFFILKLLSSKFFVVVHTTCVFVSEYILSSYVQSSNESESFMFEILYTLHSIEDNFKCICIFMGPENYRHDQHQN